MTRTLFYALIALLVLLCTLALFLAAPASAQPARQINERPAASWWLVAQGDWGSVWVGGRLLWQRTWLVEVWR